MHSPPPQPETLIQDALPVLADLVFMGNTSAGRSPVSGGRWVMR